MLDTLAMNELEQAIKIGRLAREGIISTWVVPCSGDDVKQWFNENEFKHKAEISWIMMNYNGLPQPGLLVQGPKRSGFRV